MVNRNCYKYGNMYVPVRRHGVVYLISFNIMREVKQVRRNEYNRLPEWFKVPMSGGPNFVELKNLLKSGGLNTVCIEAKCPNIGECWEDRSATFMILGEICTRACRYCAVSTGRPGIIDLDEPRRLAESVERLNLEYCVITSVDRDDLLDGGAGIFAESIKRIRSKLPFCGIEVLIPDFQGSETSLLTVLNAIPNVLNHNIETVERIFPMVRPRGNYSQSLSLLRKVKEQDPHIVTKSGMMVGLGEELDEILETIYNLRSVGCDLLTIGQYLQPSQKHFPVSRFYTPGEFDYIKVEAVKLGFTNVASGPLVRSSYRAGKQLHSVLSNG